MKGDSLLCYLYSLDYAVNIRKKKSQNIISFCIVFAPIGHIYKPLIEKPRDHLDSDLFLLIIVDGKFLDSTLYSFTRAKM